jgi:hypothetical protein
MSKKKGVVRRHIDSIPIGTWENKIPLPPANTLSIRQVFSQLEREDKKIQLKTKNKYVKKETK